MTYLQEINLQTAANVRFEPATIWAPALPERHNVILHWKELNEPICYLTLMKKGWKTTKKL